MPAIHTEAQFEDEVCQALQAQAQIVAKMVREFGPFFIKMAVSQASTAPASSSRSITPGHRRGSRSSTFASTWTTCPGGAGGASNPVETKTRTVFERFGSSLVPAPVPTAATIIWGSPPGR